MATLYWNTHGKCQVSTPNGTLYTSDSNGVLTNVAAGDVAFITGLMGGTAFSSTPPASPPTDSAQYLTSFAPLPAPDYYPPFIRSFEGTPGLSGSNW